MIIVPVNLLDYNLGEPRSGEGRSPYYLIKVLTHYFILKVKGFLFFKRGDIKNGY